MLAADQAARDQRRARRPPRARRPGQHPDGAARRSVRRRAPRGGRPGRPADEPLQRGPHRHATGRAGSRSTRRPTTRGCRPRTRTCIRSWTRGRTSRSGPRCWVNRVAIEDGTRDRGRVPDPRPAHAGVGQGAARGDPERRRDRHAEAADAVGHRPRRAPPRVRDRDARPLARRRRQPRRPRRGDRPVGREEADDPHLDAVVGDRAVLDLRARPRPARPDDALRLGAVRHEHGALGLPDDRERLLPDAERLPRPLARDRAAALVATTATVRASIRATSPTPRVTTSA